MRKMLIYVPKEKPYLYVNSNVLKASYDRYTLSNEKNFSAFGEPLTILNGKVMGEFEYEIEHVMTNGLCDRFSTSKTEQEELLKKSCLTLEEMHNYLLGNNDGGWSIKIKNLNIYDQPKELSNFYKDDDDFKTAVKYYNGCLPVDCKFIHPIDRAPQNMMYARDRMLNEYILLSIRSKWSYEIAKGNKIFEIRRKILNEMYKQYCSGEFYK